MVILKIIFYVTSSTMMHRLFILFQDNLRLQHHLKIQLQLFQILIWARQLFHPDLILMLKECHQIAVGFQLINSSNSHSILEDHLPKEFQDLEVFPNRFLSNNYYRSSKLSKSVNNRCVFKQE